MATNIFPGVYVNIVDNSFFTQPLPGVVAFMCIFAEKGPDNVPRLVTSLQDLVDTYGLPNKAYYGEGWYVAKQFVEILGNLYVMRVLPDDRHDVTTGIDPNTGLPIVDTAEYANICLKFNSVANAVQESYVNELSSVSVIDAGLTNGDYDVCLRGVGRGEWYNKLAIKLTEASDYSTFNCYNLDIYQELEDTGEYALYESFLISFNPEAVDISNDSIYIVDVLDRYSNLMRAHVSEEIDPTKDWGAPFTTRLSFNHGSDGNIYSATTGYLDWYKAQNHMIYAYSGTIYNPVTGEQNYEMTDPECLEFSIVFDAGYPYEVKNTIVDLCESRTDCFALLDLNDTPRAETALTKRRNQYNWQTFRAALYDPYTKIYDSYTGTYIWITPLYHVAKCLAKTERDYDLWWPFAGLTRGSLSGINDIRYKLRGNYKNDFKLYQINPIMRWSHGGDCVWGNWTCQSRPSALQFIHVVLTVLYIKRVLEWNLKYYVFDLNDSYTWELMRSNVAEFLSDMKSRRALEKFSVNVYANDYDKKIGRCKVDVDLKVVGAIEVIQVTLNVL